MPSSLSTFLPSNQPTGSPSTIPTDKPTKQNIITPTSLPSSVPSQVPSMQLTNQLANRQPNQAASPQVCRRSSRIVACRGKTLSEEILYYNYLLYTCSIFLNCIEVKILKNFFNKMTGGTLFSYAIKF